MIHSTSKFKFTKQCQINKAEKLKIPLLLRKQTMLSIHQTQPKRSISIPIQHQTITPRPAYDAANMSQFPLQTGVVTHYQDSADDSDGVEEDEEARCPIHIEVHTPLHVYGDNNKLAIDPSMSANKIAMAVVSALKQMAGGDSCIPMVDGEGQPRAIKVTIVAGTRVQGSRNTIGEKAVLSLVADVDAKHKAVEMAQKEKEDHEKSRGGKHERANSNPTRMDSKRTRLD